MLSAISGMSTRLSTGTVAPARSKASAGPEPVAGAGQSSRAEAAGRPADPDQATVVAGEDPTGGAQAARAPDNTHRVEASEGPARVEGLALSAAELRTLQALKDRDREVRSHEAAHQAAAGGLAGSARYTYQAGPDGQRYAVEGEVSVDTSPERDPAQTIAKMERVAAAAQAPAQPSAQDRSVAASARRAIVEARAELREAEAAERAEAEEGPEARGAVAPNAAEQAGAAAPEGQPTDAAASGPVEAARPAAAPDSARPSPEVAPRSERALRAYTALGASEPTLGEEHPRLA
jgi:hypothetical protein